MLEVRKEGHDVVRYPVSIERGLHWDGVRPGDYDPYPITLPEHGELNSHMCYVPAGWFWAGGDPGAYDDWPRRRYWADAFVMQKFSVTNREYILFLDDLVAQGREGEALRHVPRERAGTTDELGAMIYGRDHQGRFLLRPDAEGDVWLPDYPVMMVDWHAAYAYAAWWSTRDAHPWRLPQTQEWEKSARGVDGRFFPWGDFLDPSWCVMKNSHAGYPGPHVVESFPVDCSVYGVRGLGGNMRDWCANIYRSEPPASDVVQADSSRTTAGSHRTARGGSWDFSVVNCHAATRYGFVPTDRSSSLGVRLVRSYRGGGFAGMFEE